MNVCKLIEENTNKKLKTDGNWKTYCEVRNLKDN